MGRQEGSDLGPQTKIQEQKQEKSWEEYRVKARVCKEYYSELSIKMSNKKVFNSLLKWFRENTEGMLDFGEPYDFINTFYLDIPVENDIKRVYFDLVKSVKRETEGVEVKLKFVIAGGFIAIKTTSEKLYNELLRFFNGLAMQDREVGNVLKTFKIILDSDTYYSVIYIDLVRNLRW